MCEYNLQMILDELKYHIINVENTIESIIRIVFK
jgi:hypothetical protein